MIHYKDKTFCNREDCANKHQCDRYASQYLFKEAEDFGLPVAVADFSDTCPEYIETDEG